MRRVLVVAIMSISLFAGASLAFAQTTTNPPPAPPSGQTTPTNPPSGTGSPSIPSSGNSGQSFISLSNIPALGTGPGAAPSLPQFLQGLYTICIGIAVVLAILQLIRGGITYMLGESMGTLEQAKHTILVSLLGLVLVLSPYIVFSIINPAILSFNLANDVSGLTSGLPSSSGNSAWGTNAGYNNLQGSTAQQAGTNNDNTGGTITYNGQKYLRCDGTSCDSEVNSCESAGGNPAYECRNQQTQQFSGAGILNGQGTSSFYGCSTGSYNYIECMH